MIRIPLSLLVVLVTVLPAGTAVAAGPGGFAAPVEVKQAEERSLAPVVWVAGEVISRHNARISAETSGTLTWVAEVGERVRKQGVVARIDAEFLKLQLEEARAKVKQVASQRGFLEKEVRRLQRLAKSNNTAQTLLDQTEADLSAAQADHASAQARVRQIEDRIRRSEVRAPFPGIIVERFMQPGEWVDSGDQVVQLLDTGVLEVRAMAPLSTLPFLRRGLEVRIQARGEQAGGRIRSFVAAGHTASHLVDVRIDLLSAEWPVGKTLRVALPAAAPRKVVVVPRDALVLRRGGAAVFRVGEDGAAQRVMVKTGAAEGDVIEVQGDIAAGDTVVVRGNERLRPGQKVRIKRADEPAPTAQASKWWPG